MQLVERFRTMLEAKKLSPEELELRAGLAQSYLRDVENGHLLPSLEIWERLARAIEVPLAKLFYDGESVPHLPNLPGRRTANEIAGGPDVKRLQKNRTQPFSKSDNQRR